MNFIKKLFSKDDSEKTLEKYSLRVEKVNQLEAQISPLTDEELKAKTADFKKRLEAGETLDDLMPEAFAVVREASKRVSGKRHYDVQLIGGMILHDGNIAEMRTGEGKTLMATLPAYLNALSGKGVHVVTVNDYLSQRDAVWMGQVYNFLGLTVGSITSAGSYIYDPNHQDLDEERDEKGNYKVVHEFLRPVSRKEAYEADITYGPNNEFGFDYLRDHITYNKSELRQREYNFAIVDEVDSILIDEARTPLIISVPDKEAGELYKRFAQISMLLEEKTDYEVDEKDRAVSLFESGIDKAEKALGIENLYTERGIKFVHHLENALRAKSLYKRDKEYVVKNGQIIIVDEFTGRLQPGRRWSDGMHQAIEAKEGVNIQNESRTFASITYQNYFRMYEKLSGMTGTAKTSSEEFFKVYGLDVVVVPTNKKIEREDKNDLVFQTEIGKFKALAKKIKELNEKGQPVLIGTVSIEKNELLSDFLNKEGVMHQVLNAKQHEKEGEVIAQAGRKGAVTIATNMAGRGIDIILGGAPFNKQKYDEVKSLGGLFVLGTERHEARRIDNQLRGRSGRQGDPGTTQFFVSLEDPLMRIFASDFVRNMMGRFGIPEDQPIENIMVTRTLETAQTKIEGINFDRRRAVLDFDNVLNTQRNSIYKRRQNILLGGKDVLDQELESLKEFSDSTSNLDEIIKEKKELLGEETFYESIRRLFLQSIDFHWVDHLDNMNHVRSSVSLRAVGQRDPLIEYKKEGLSLFNNLKYNVQKKVLELLPQIGAGAFKKEEERMKETVKNAKLISSKNDGGSGSGSSQTNSQVINSDKIGRNELVTIIKDGEEKEMKYKKAEKMLEEGWSIKK